MKILFLLIFARFDFSFGDVDPREVKCQVCKAVVREMINEIGNVDPRKKIQVGGYRLDEDGNPQEKLVSYIRREISYARSGMHLAEVMETICKAMDKYVRARRKTDGKLILIELMTKEGTLNPDISNVDLIQDSDLNKSLEFYCEAIVEEFEDTIYDIMGTHYDNPAELFCFHESQLCDESTKDEL